MSLRDRAKALSNTLPFMENREKGNLNDLMDGVITINQYGFLEGDDGKYVVFAIKEDDNNFYFGSSVLSDALIELDSQGSRAEIESEGLPTLLNKQKAKKSGRMYTNATFFPEDAQPIKIEEFVQVETGNDDDIPF